MWQGLSGKWFAPVLVVVCLANSILFLLKEFSAVAVSVCLLLALAASHKSSFERPAMRLLVVWWWSVVFLSLANPLVAGVALGVAAVSSGVYLHNVG